MPQPSLIGEEVALPAMMPPYPRPPRLQGYTSRCWTFHVGNVVSGQWQSLITKLSVVSPMWCVGRDGDADGTGFAKCFLRLTSVTSHPIAGTEVMGVTVAPHA